MDITIVIPLYNEDESLNELFKWIKSSLAETGLTYEVFFIDDGSRDDSWEVVKKLSEENSNVRGVRFRRNYGKSAALNVGFGDVKGDVVITMDADMQDSPEEISGLYKMIMEDGFDMISGWKKKRHDPIMKTLPSKFFNGTTSFFTGIKLHDANCGLKAYKREVVEAIEIYGEMHRFIPVIAKKAGFDKIGEKVVEHRARLYGTTKFGLERFINGFLDLLSILFVTRFGKQPMHLFGTIGTLSFISGGLLTVWVLAEKQYRIHNHLDVRDVVDQPLFYLALVMTVVGVQLFLTGFLAELVSRNAPDRNDYKVRERI